jgi:hypothetical protein
MSASLVVRPWLDPLIDTLGHDPRSLYVETFWLPTLGPTALLLLRHLAAQFDRCPEGLTLPLAGTSQALGLGCREGTSSPLVRSLARLAQFDLACDDGRGTIAVRRNVPPINRRHVRRLTPELQVAHTEWVEKQLAEPPQATARRRARRLALALLEQGDDPDHTERVLHTVGFHPSICHESTKWARERYRADIDALGESA